MLKKLISCIKILILLGICLLLCLASTAHAESNIIRIAFNCYAVPYHYIGEDGSYKGMHIDIMSWIAKQKGLDIIYVPYETNRDCLEALKRGAVDLVLGHRTNDSEAAGFQYTSELSSSYLCLYAPNELAKILKNTTDYRSYSVAIEYGATAYPFMSKMGVRSYLARRNQVSVFQTLVDKKADMALAVYDCFSYLLYQAGLKDDFTVLRSYISPVSYAILLRPNNMELFDVIDAGLTEIRASGSYESIYDRWTVKDDNIVNLQSIRRIWNVFIGVIFAALIVIISSFIINRMLKVKVAEKTKELYEANIELDKRMIQLENESRIRYGLIEFAPSGMVLFDTDYKIVLMNHAALRLSGLEACDVGSDVRSLDIFGDIIKHIKHDLFSQKSNDERFGRPTTLELGNFNDKRNYRYNIYRLYNENGISSVLLNVEDVTIEEREKQELFEREKNKLLNRLIASIAHEIKNPLMAIRTATSLLKTQGNDPEVQEAFVKFVPNEVDRINQLIESLINYARPVKGEREILCLANVINECLYLVNIAAKKDRIRLEIDLDDTVTVCANRDRIKQSIMNIIMNGIESMEKKLRIEPKDLLTMSIKVKKDKHYAYVHIHDEGIGMSEEDIKRCAEPFYTTKEWGTGLGLALVQQFITENQGVLSIKSEIGRYTEVMLKFGRNDVDETKNIDN